jgi:L-ascorbate metabolism protein UlaG (beta-lactamase superfamily)
MSDLGFAFTWYGHSCVEIETEAGTRLILDPWFSNPTSPRAADSVDSCDVLLVSHGHFDHLGGEVGAMDRSDAVTIAARTSPFWPCIHEMSLWLGDLDTTAEVVGMNKGGTVTARGVGITMVRADHSAGDWAADQKVMLDLGEPVGFVLQLENGRRVYLAGDTDVYGDMALIRELLRPDVAFLPIGGHFTMDPRRAAAAVELLGVSTVVPIHWGTFPILAGTPDQLRAALSDRGLGSIEVLSPERGERVE